MTERRWILDFWKPEDSNKSPVEKELDKEHQGNQQAERQFVKLLAALETFGPTLPMPLNKNLGDGLFELRNKGDGKRYYYAETNFEFDDPDDSHRKKVILLLGAVGSKNNASEQQRDIGRARKRLAKMTKDNTTLLVKGNKQ